MSVDANTAGGAEADADSIDERDERALTDVMSVLDDLGRVRGASGLYLVVSHSGREFLVDADACACECPDAEYRGVTSKHQRRVAFETSHWPLPTATDPADLSRSRDS